MESEFEMSMIGELRFFLGLQIRLNCTFGPLSFQKLRLWTP